MPDPVAVAPLVPRGGANKAKKKRPGFRPVGKSSKSSSTGTNKSPSSSKQKAHGSQRKEPPASEPQAQRDDEELIISKSTGKEMPEEKVPTEENQVNHQSSLPVETLKETLKAPPIKASTTRKRKQSTSISAGLRSTSGPSNKNLEQSTANKRRSTRAASEPAPSSALVATASSSAAEDKASPRASSSRTTTPRASSRKSTALVVANASALSVPAAPPQDRDILERMVAENTEGARLTSFCSAFKGNKEPRRRKGAGPKTAPAGNTLHHSTTRSNKQKGGSNNANNNNNNNNSSNINSRNVGSKRNAPDATGAPVVKVVDGEIVLQESSLVVPGQRRTVQEVEEEFQDVVEEDAQLAIVGASYNSFVNRKGPQHWTVKETGRFFEALRQLGTDFCSMEAFFDNRSRKQLKRKYRTELIRNPALVEMALDPRNKTNVDMSVFDVEVDPKAIEAAAQDEPPEYIPTDGGEEELASAAAATTTTTDHDAAPTPDENTAPVIAAAVATAAAIAATNATDASTSNNLDKWKDVVAARDEQEEEIVMEDFFHEEVH